VSKATPLFTIAALALTAGCSDKPALTAPTRPNPLVSPPTPTTVTVGPPAILEGFTTYVIVRGLNALGDAVGVTGGFGGGPQAARWAAGSTVPIHVAGGEPQDINSAGQIVGDSLGYATLWTPNGAGGYTRTSIAQQLPSATISSAYGINANGQVVGWYRVAGSAGGWVDKCFIWTPKTRNATTGSVTTIQGLGGNYCAAADINSAGYVVGGSTTVDGEMHGFIWTPGGAGRLGKIRDLTPGGGPSNAAAINDVGWIAGQHLSNAAIWKPVAGGSYQMTDLGTFTGTQSWAYDINDAGFVVGAASRENPYQVDAFFWQNGAFTLLPGTTALTDAVALTNSNGNSVQVVGVSSDAANGTHTGLRWTVTMTSAASAASASSSPN
jgi:probable HAF family extracellular repeat protein